MKIEKIFDYSVALLLLLFLFLSFYAVVVWIKNLIVNATKVDGYMLAISYGLVAIVLSEYMLLKLKRKL